MIMSHGCVYIETYGCQMNKLDSEIVQAILESDGYHVTSDMAEADIILLNTCGVRENAETRIHGRVAELSSMRRTKPELVFGIIGCMAQRLEESLISSVVSIVVGPDAYRRLPGLIGRAHKEGVVDTLLDQAETYDDIPPVRSDPWSAWVAVMRGCNNLCSYCIVPHTRGRERSIGAANILDEVRRLVDSGCREVTLLGQNVNSYHNGNVDFARLLDDVARTGIPWVRFLTSHPKDLDDGIISVMADRTNVCPHLHLPVQSGSDRILAAMNRRYTMEDYIRRVDAARAAVPGISLTTDIMFGFPGETEEDAAETVALMERVRYDFAFLYRYSEREGTAACGMTDAVPEPARIRRLSEAIERQRIITAERNRERIGSTRVVLVKAPSKDGKGWFGMTDISVPTVVTASDDGVCEGMFVKAVIDSTTGASLVGRIVE